MGLIADLEVLQRFKKHCENMGFNKCNTCNYYSKIFDKCALNVPEDWDIEEVKNELKHRKELIEDDTIKD